MGYRIVWVCDLCGRDTTRDNLTKVCKETDLKDSLLVHKKELEICDSCLSYALLNPEEGIRWKMR